MSRLKYNDDCELCYMKVQTKVYYIGREFIVLDCLACGIPMIVSVGHRKKISPQAMGRAYDLSKELFPKFQGFRPGQRKIKDHWHRHLMTGDKGNEN